MKKSKKRRTQQTTIRQRSQKSIPHSNQKITDKTLDQLSKNGSHKQPIEDAGNTKTKSRTKKILKIPIVGLVSLFLSVYYIWEPKLTVAKGLKTSYSMDYTNLNDSSAVRLKGRIPLTNRSIKPGYVKTIEVNPNGIAYLPYTLQPVEFKKKWIGYQETFWLEFQMTVIYPKHLAAVQTANPNVRNRQRFRVKLYDNDGNAILNDDEKSSFYMLMVDRLLK